MRRVEAFLLRLGWRYGMAGVATLTLAPSAIAQVAMTGTIAGRVVDIETRRAVPTVMVTVRGPSGSIASTVATDAHGEFRISRLPPGRYALRFELEHFYPYSQPSVSVEPGEMLYADVELLPLTLTGDEVMVLGHPTPDPEVDAPALAIGGELATRLPLAVPTGKGGAVRSFEQLAELAPTVQRDKYGASIAGATSIENRYVIDGLSVNDPARGYNGTPLSSEFIARTNVFARGAPLEYGAGGGVIEAVTKSGSNEVFGSIFAHYTPWQGMPRLPSEQDAIRTYSRAARIWDMGAELGGPIVRDRLWFYSGVSYSETRYTLTRDLMVLETGPDGSYVRGADGWIASHRVPGTRSLHEVAQAQLQYIAKLTYAPTPADWVELAHYGTPSTSGGNGAYSLDYETGLPLVRASPGADIAGTYAATSWRQRFDARDVVLRWQHAAADGRTRFDTLAGWHHGQRANLPADGSAIGASEGIANTPQFVYQRTVPAQSITQFEPLPDPSICELAAPEGELPCPVPEYSVGGPELVQSGELDRFQLREIVSRDLDGAGHHVIRAGLELELLAHSFRAGYPGKVALRENLTGNAINDYRRYGFLTAPDAAVTLSTFEATTRSLNLAGFLEDRWTFRDRLMLELGVRYDAQYLYADGGLALALPNRWSPRAALDYRLPFDDRATVSASLAIFHPALPLETATAVAASGPQLTSRRAQEVCTPNDATYPASCDDPAHLQTLPGKGSSDPNQRWRVLGVGGLAVDSEILPPSSSELSLGVGYRLARETRVRLTYLRRWVNRIVEDMSLDEGSTYFFGNPGRGAAATFPSAERRYDAAIASIETTFADGWVAQAAYTLSSLRGNWGGPFDPRGEAPITGTPFFDVASLTVNRNGPLESDRRHTLRAAIARDIALGPRHRLQIAGSYRGRSGTPTSYLGTDLVYGNDATYLLPRGSGPRLPWEHTLDVRLGYTFVETERRSLALTLDVFNVLDFASVVARSERYTTRDVEPITGDVRHRARPSSDRLQIDPALIRVTDGDPRPFDESDRSPSFGAPLRYQEPITLRVGVKASF